MAAKLNPRVVSGKFRGRGARQRLLVALTEQFIVGNDAELAAKLLSKVSIKEYKTGTLLMEQGGEDTHLVFRVFVVSCG